MTKTQDRQVYLDVAKGMGMLGVVASHCLVETSLGILSDWYGFFMLAVFYVYTGWRYALRYGKERTVSSHTILSSSATRTGSSVRTEESGSIWFLSLRLKVTVKREPRPGVLSTQMSRSIILAMLRVIAIPGPVP